VMNTLHPSILLVGVLVLCHVAEAAPDRDARRYVDAIEKINAAHLKSPGEVTEDEVQGEIPKSAVAALKRVLKAKSSPETTEALVKCGEAALDLAAMEHFGQIRARLSEVDRDAAARLGDAVARDRFLVRGIGAFEAGYLDHFADLTSAILDAYDEVFGFKEWSKVPGKKIRIRVHLEDRITRPPHFAPQFPYHSEIDMPVIDPAALRSPTSKGHMMFYGLCHEFGHLIAMWGDRRTMEDHHAWAHYTGVVIVEHLSGDKGKEEILADLRDLKWRSLSLEREKPENRAEPSTRNREGVMALLITLHDTVGAKMIGAALNHMEEEAMGHRINQVRYYGFGDLKEALRKVVENPEDRKEVGELFP
jgi:hypothetical protein